MRIRLPPAIGVFKPSVWDGRTPDLRSVTGVPLPPIDAMVPDTRAAHCRAKTLEISPDMAALVAPILPAQGDAAPRLDRDMMQAIVDESLTFAREGKCIAAMSHLNLIADLHGADAGLQHACGVVFSLCGEEARARESFNCALALCPNFHFSLHELGDLSAAAQKPAEAIEWYLRATQAAPNWLLGYERAADLLQGEGKQQQALEVLLMARGHCALTSEVTAQLVDLLIWHRRRVEAVEVMADLARSGHANAYDQARLLSIMSETGQYWRLVEHADVVAQFWPEDVSSQVILHRGHAKLALSFDRSAVLAAAEARENGAAWRSPDAVLAALQQAIADARPFSLIRLGDGEGRFMAFQNPEFRRGADPADADAIIDSIWHNWFGRSFAEEPASDTLELSHALAEAIEQADIVGITKADRLAHDGRHFGYLAYLNQSVSALNLNALTDALVNIRLHDLSPHYQCLLQGQAFIGVVSPHAGLAELLGRHMKITVCTEYLVPGEGSLRSTGGPIRHFPDLYRHLLGALKVPHIGAVFLVAAGLPGKIYCNVIRQRGGIAIDIGSVADAWMGLQTRAGQFQDPGWALPP